MGEAGGGHGRKSRCECRASCLSPPPPQAPGLTFHPPPPALLGDRGECFRKNAICARHWQSLAIKASIILRTERIRSLPPSSTHSPRSTSASLLWLRLSAAAGLGGFADCLGTKSGKLGWGGTLQALRREKEELLTCLPPLNRESVVLFCFFSGVCIDQHWEYSDPALDGLA